MSKKSQHIQGFDNQQFRIRTMKQLQLKIPTVSYGPRHLLYLVNDKKAADQTRP